MIKAWLALYLACRHVVSIIMLVFYQIELKPVDSRDERETDAHVRVPIKQVSLISHYVYFLRATGQICPTYFKQIMRSTQEMSEFFK